MNSYEGITTVLLALSTLIHLHADTQEDDTISVTGPATLVTDGTEELTLTCGTDISASFGYGWRFPGNDTRDCESRPVKNVCNFRPRVDDDMQNVTCAATNIDAATVLKATYTLDLLHPPESRAAITIEPPQTEPLKQGDNITCTVSGGKPRVTSVTFHCQHPDHDDQEDDVSDDGRNVSSSITVNTSQATEVNMTCTCSAHWNPGPDLYDNITYTEVMLQYRAIVTNFTVNGSADETGPDETVAESEKVMFWCQGAGRPPPRMILHKRANNTAIASSSTPGEGLLHPIGSARCEDLGTYTCEANNKFPDPKSQTLQLFVKFTPQVTTPRPVDNGLSTVTIVVIAVPTTGGLGLVVIVIVIVIKTNKKAKKRKACNNTRQQNYENKALRSESEQTSQRVTATVQPQAHSQTYHNQMSPVFLAEPGYACPADMLPSGSVHAAEASTTKPNPYDPGYASADQIGMSTDAQRVAYVPRSNSLKSRSANQYWVIPLQPAEPANKPQDDGVDEYNVLGGQGPTSGPDPTYSHINKVSKNQ